jgi:hypothetical protein
VQLRFPILGKILLFFFSHCSDSFHLR